MRAYLVIAAILVGSAVAATFPEEDGVLVLGEKNFDDALEAHDTLLVEFYAPWCGHCKKLAPEYAAAAAVLAERDPPLALAKVDATEHRDLGEQFGVTGFPTLKFFRNGKPAEYTGGRTKNEIVNWVVKKSGPPAVTLTSVDAAKEHVDEAEVTVIGFFEDAESTEARAFLNVAGTFDDIPFGITTDAAVAAEYGASAPAVVLFKDFDEKKNEYDGDFKDVDALQDFVSGNRLPMAIEFTQEAAPKIFGGSIKTHLLMFADKAADDFESLVDDLRTVGKANRGKALAIYVTLDSERVMQYFGVTEDDLPTAVLVNMPDGGQMKKFAFEADAVNADNLAKFADSYFAGDLKPFLKSEDIPADNDGPVTVLVGKNFEDIALDQSKDVLVEFYAPWCGHCKQLEPKYNELGKLFSGIDSVVIAKMDATANEVDHPDVNIRGFPTLKFFPANSDKVLDFNGERDVDGLSAFIEENAGIDFETPSGHDSEL